MGLPILPSLFRSTPIKLSKDVRLSQRLCRYSHVNTQTMPVMIRDGFSRSIAPNRYSAVNVPIPAITAVIVDCTHLGDHLPVWFTASVQHQHTVRVEVDANETPVPDVLQESWVLAGDPIQLYQVRRHICPADERNAYAFDSPVDRL